MVFGYTHGMEPMPDPATTFVAVMVSRALSWASAKLKVEPVMLASALRYAVLALVGIAATVAGVTVSPAIVAGSLVVLGAAEALLAKRTRAAVTPNTRVAISQAEVDAWDELWADDLALLDDLDDEPLL
jgi:hypothetical protein